MIIDSPIISGSYAASGSLNQFGNVTITGSLTVSGPIIGSITGSADSASFATTASYWSGSIVNAQSSSFAANAQNAVTASYLSNYIPPFPFTGSASISGSLTVNGPITAQTLIVQTITSSEDFVTGSTHFGSIIDNTHQFTGSVSISGSLAVNGSNAILTNQTSSMSASYAVSSSYASTSTSASFATTSSNALTASYLSGYVSPFPFTGSAIISGSLTVTGSFNVSGSGTLLELNADVLEVTGSVIATSGFTGSLQGTASYAVTASNAVTASYLTGYISPFPYTGSAIISGSLEITGSASISNLSGSGVRYLVADSSGSITAQSASAALKATQEFTSTAGQTTFAVTNGYSTGYVDVFINGSKLSTAEFTDTSGTNIVLATGSFVNDIVEVVKYTPAAGVTNNVLRQLTTFTASAGQTVFSASYTPGLLDIFYNGSRLTPADFTANNGTYFTLATGSAVNDILDVLVYSYQVGAFSGIGGVGTAAQVAYFDTTNSITGSPNFTISGSTMTVTGSLIVSGSGTFTNIGPAVFSGSLTSTAGFTGSFSGTATSASYAANADLLDGLDSTVFTLTSSFAAQTASFTAFTSSILSYTSSLNTKTSSFATTSSNTFEGIQTVNSNLIVTGSITAQTLVVQTITSSVDFVTGSTRFGSVIGNTHIFTGSMAISGGLVVTTTSPELTVSATGVTLGNVSTDAHNITGSVGITGSLAVRAANSSFGLGYYNAAGTLTAGFYNTSTGHGQIYLYNSSSVQTMQIDGSGGSAIFASTLTATNGVRCINSGVDAVFQDAFVGVYSGNSNEQNAIQASVSSVAGQSGFKFQVSNGGGSASRTTVADFLRDRQIFYHNVLPAANGTQDLGSSSLRWGTVFTSDLDMSNGIGDYTIVEGEEDLFLYNNKTNKVFKFMIQEVDPSKATPKMKK